MRILVTGAAGFIGSHLSDALLARGHEVVGVENLSHGTQGNLSEARRSDRFELHELDVRDRDAVVALAAGSDVVVHLAALKIPRYGHSLDTVLVNVEGGRTALEAARAAGARCVMASTSDVYGKNPRIPFDEESDAVLGPPTSRRWAYAGSKLAVEHMAFGYQEEFGVGVTLLRYFGSYGERQYLDWWGGPQGVFLSAIAEGRPIEIHGDGTQTRCFIHVSDLVEATARAAETEAAAGEVLNVGTTEEIAIRDLALLMHELSGRPGPPRVELVPYEALPHRYEDVQRRVPDLAKAERILGFRPALTLREGIARLWAWYDSR